MDSHPRKQLFQNKYLNLVFLFQYIAVPVENEIRLYIRETWDVGFTLKDDCIVQVSYDKLFQLIYYKILHILILQQSAYF